MSLALGAACAAQTPPDFARSLYPFLERAQCPMCHNDNGVASRTRLQFPPEGASRDEVTAFGYRIGVLVNRDEPERSLLFQKPTNRIPHAGGERIHPKSDAEKSLRAWVTYLASLPMERVLSLSGANGKRKAAPAEVRRLTHNQYNQTVAHLLGDETHPAEQFPQEDFINGFTNQSAGQSITPVQQEAYSQAAGKLARNAFRGGDLHGLVPCKAASNNDAACADRFIRQFGSKAFRRPVTGAETARYRKLFALGGAQLVVEAMLQSPSFLFHLEQGPNGEFEQYRTASRLSYFLWNTMPDEELFRAAADSKLGTAQEIENAARRMLRDPRAEQAADAFLEQWLRFDRLKSAVRDPRFFPDFSSELGAAMREETRRLFRHLAWENGNLMEFFSARYAYLNNDLARLYGLPAPAREFARVDFPADSKRAGILGEGAFLTLTSKPEETSPTERGLFVREHFLCQMVPPPPPGVNTTLPPPTDDKPVTNKQRLQAHLSQPVCAGCHGLIDPIGFGLEQFDAIGRYRERQVITIYPTFDESKRGSKTKPTEHRLPLETAAFVKGLPNSEFSSPASLGRVLAQEPACQKCVVKQLFRYATGRMETPPDQPTIEAIAERFRASHFDFQTLIIAIVTSQPFLGAGT